MSYIVDDLCAGFTSRVAEANGRPDNLFAIIHDTGSKLDYIAAFDNQGNAEKVNGILNKYSIDVDDARMFAYNLRASLV